MNNDVGSRIEPTIAEGLPHVDDLDLASSLDEALSADTHKAFEALGDSLDEEGGHEDDFGLDEDEGASSSMSAAADEVPPLADAAAELQHGAEAPAEPGSEPDVDPAFDHIDQIADAEPLADVEANAAHEPALETPAAAAPAGSAVQHFMDNKLTLNDLVREHLANQPAAEPAPGTNQTADAVRPDLRSQPQFQPVQNGAQLQGSLVQGQAAVADDRVRMGLGSAAMLMGAKGLGGLGSMLGNGGRAINTAISDFTFGRTEKELGETLAFVRTELAGMRSGGLSILEDPDMADDDKQAVLKQFLASAENQIKFDNLVNKLDHITDLSGKLITKGLDKGMDGDAVMQRAVEPVHRLLKDNEKLLKNLSLGDKSLYERLESAVDNLFQMLRDLVLQVAAMFQTQGAEHRNSGPRMG